MTLNELAEQSSVGARTIRSYIEKGLLPGAETRGPNSYYTASHLDRLQAIRLLRHFDPQVSLQDIRRWLHQLTEQQIRDIASGKVEAVALAKDAEDRSADSAMDYLASLRHSWQGASKTKPSERSIGPLKAPSRSSEDRTAVAQLVELLRNIVGASSTPGSTRREAWYRFQITPDIELSVRGDFHEDHLAQFQEITDLLRHALTRGIKAPNTS